MTLYVHHLLLRHKPCLPHKDLRFPRSRQHVGCQSDREVICCCFNMNLAESEADDK